MKKQVLKMLKLITMLLLVIIMPIESFAATVSDEIQLTEDGVQAQADSKGRAASASNRRITVALSSTYAAVDGVSSLQFSLQVEKGVDPKFVFNSSLMEKASITEYRYDSTTGQMNIYVSGTKQLFDSNGDPLKIGYVSLVSADATVRVIPDSLKYVYGTKLRDTVTTDDSVDSVEHQHVFDTPAADAWIWTAAGESGKNPSCTVEATCLECGDTFSFDCVVSEDAEQSKAPTCTEDGITIYKASAELNTKHEGKKIYTNPNVYTETFPAIGHEFTDYVSNNDATCLEDGTKTANCNHGCGAIDTIADEGSRTGHTLSYTDSKDGYYHFVTCKDCSLNIKEPHSFKDDVCTSCGAEKPAEAEHTHIYGEPEINWSEDYTSFTATFTCTADDCTADDTKSFTTEEYSTDGGKIVSEPTCQKAGEMCYTATFTFNGKEYKYTKNVDIPAVDHKFTDYKPDNNANCTKDGTLTAECDYGCGKTNTKIDEGSKTKHTYTKFTACEGGIHHISYCDICGEPLETPHSYNEGGVCINCGFERSPEHTCTYGEPEFVWDDLYNCKAVFTCTDKDCGAIMEVVCAVTTTETPAACKEDGSLVYTAAAEFENKTYTDTKTVVLKSTGHSYIYSDEKNDKTHTLKCKICGDTQEEPHSFVDGTCSICGAEEPTDHVHTYSNPTFTWSEDYTACDAIFVCKDGDNKQTTACRITSTITAATCENDGKAIYTATAIFDGKTYTDTQTVTLPARGHVYSYTDNKDGKTHTITCANCDYSQKENHTYKNGICSSCGSIESSNSVLTGDTANPYIFIILIIAAMVCAGLIIFKVRKKE